MVHLRFGVHEVLGLRILFCEGICDMLYSGAQEYDLGADLIFIYVCMYLFVCVCVWRGILAVW